MKAISPGSRMKKGMMRLLAATMIITAPFIAAAAQLTVGDGVVVKGMSGGEIVVRDTLSVRGSVLTSVKDDSASGQTGQSPQTPQPGDWRGVRFEASALGGNNRLELTRLRYAGQDGMAALYLRSSSVLLQGLEISYSLGAGILAAGGSTATISQVILKNNAVGIEVGAATPVVQNSFFSGNAFGMLKTNPGPPSMLATGNWWGHPSGPLDSSDDTASGGLYNPGGLGDRVGDGINYSSWSSVIPLIAPSVSVVEGAVAGSRDVNLKLACPTATEMRIGEDPALTGAVFETFSTDKLFNLSAGDGNKTVYAQFRAGTGNSSSIVSAPVRLDTQGPSIVVANLTPGAIVNRPLTVNISATDASGVDRVEVYVNSVLQATQSGGSLAFNWNIAPLADGPHQVRIVAVDNVARSSESVLNVSVVKAPPAAPVITSPADGSAFAVKDFNVSGTSEPNTTVALLIGGAAYKQTVATGAGAFAISMTDVPDGIYVLAAVASDALGSSPRSVTSTISVDTGPPNPPPGLQATPVAGGTINLTWNQPSGEKPTNYNVYRSASSFTSRTAPGVTKVRGGLTVLKADDKPASDGDYFYAVTAVDAVGNESGISNVMTARSDRTAPTATVAFSPSGTAGIGSVNVTLTLSEAVQGTPYLSVTPPGMGPIVVVLAASSSTLWTGTFDVLASHASGAAAVSFVGKDLVGNVGSTISSGGALTLDTRGPSAVVSAGGTKFGPGNVPLTITLSESAAGTPTLGFTPPVGALVSIPLVGSDKDWTGTLTVTPAMGDGNGTFSFSSVDFFGNTGTDITVGRSLALDVTPPTIPTELVALSLTGGEVKLTWSTAGIIDPPLFNIYRTAPAQNPGPPDAPVATGVVANNFADLPGVDGSYRYAITALDPFGNESAVSNVVTALSDRTAPGAPGAASTTLNTTDQRIDVQWTAPAGEAPSSYNLYRSTSPIVSVGGMTPVRTGIAGLSVSDVPPGDGIFYFAVTSQDAVGNESGPSANSAPLAFDFAPPVISVAGMVDGGFYKSAVTPVISATDASLQTLTSTLDGAPYTSGTPVGAEGTHTLSVQASDSNGNASGRNITFEIDLTLPTVTVSGVADGASYAGTVFPVASFFDVFMDVTTLTINGAPFVSGTAVSADGSYTLVATATDKAGNGRTVTTAFTVDGPPSVPPRLTITAAQGNSPVLDWNASPEPDVAGYHIYRNGVRLTTSPQSALTFTDSTYNTLATQTYGVTAVDAKGNESQPRSAVLPPVQIAMAGYGTQETNAVNTSFDPATGLTTFTESADPNRLNKRYIDSIRVGVTNQGSGAVSLQAISMKLKDRFATVMESLQNGPFNVAGAGTLNLEKIMPVGDDADDQRTMDVSLFSTKTSTVEVIHTFSSTLRAKDPGRRIEMFTEPMILGGMATVRMRIFNRGSVPIQIITALQDKPSPDVAVNLRTTDGALLATANLEHRGAGVTNYATHTMAEIPPGGNFLSGPVNFVVPAGSPSDVVVEGVVSRFYYRYNQADEVTGSPLTGSIGAKLSNAPYYATSSPAAAVYDQGQLVVITGRALSTADGSPVPNVPVKVGISVKGFDRYFIANTDGAGNYSLNFQPLSVEAGNYTVWAVHPSVFDRPVQSSFAILGLQLNPREAAIRMSKNFQLTFPLKVKNTGEAPISITGATVVSTTDPKVQVTTDLSGTASILAAGAETTIQVTAHADLDAPDAAGATVRVEGSGGISIARDLPVNLALSEARPIMQATPEYIETGLNRGAVKMLTVKITNKGLAALQNIEIVPPATSWMVVNRDLNAGSLDVGATMEINLTMRPDLAVAQGEYRDNLLIKSSNHVPYNVSIFAAITSSEYGNVHFLVKNTLNEFVPEALVTIQNEKVTTVVYSGKTDANGELALNDLPEGSYRYKVQAPGHEGYWGNFEVKPGVTTPVSMFLSTSFITLEWSVTPITIQDRYEIKLTSTFKTYVPEPWVEIDPPSVQLKMAPDSTFVGEFRVTNRGLIAVNNVKFTPRAPSGMTLEVMVSEIPRLEAQQTMVIPYKVTIGTHHSPLSIDLCDPFGALVETHYDFPCAGGFTTNGYTQFGVQVAVSVYGHVTDPVASIAKDICDLVSDCNDCCGLINCLGIFNPVKGVLGTLSYIDGAYDCFKALANCLGPLIPPAPPSTGSWGGGGGFGGGGCFGCGGGFSIGGGGC